MYPCIWICNRSGHGLYSPSQKFGCIFLFKNCQQHNTFLISTWMNQAACNLHLNPTIIIRSLKLAILHDVWVEAKINKKKWSDVSIKQWKTRFFGSLPLLTQSWTWAHFPVSFLFPIKNNTCGTSEKLSENWKTNHLKTNEKLLRLKVEQINPAIFCKVVWFVCFNVSYDSK